MAHTRRRLAVPLLGSGTAALALALLVALAGTADAQTSPAHSGGSSEPVTTVLDTKLTLINDIPDPSPGTDWNPAWLQVHMGQCSLGCNADPNYLKSRTLRPGGFTTQQGRNSAEYGSADITADVTFCNEWRLLRCTEYDVVRIESGNPTRGYPWISIGGNFHEFNEEEEVTITSNGHTFRARRNNDMTGAKDMVVKVVSL
jgi:hypothetical protein